MAYQAPYDDRCAQPVTVASVVGLYVASFVVHGLVLGPSLSSVRRKLGAGPESIEAAMTLPALGAVSLLMRREVSDDRKVEGSNNWVVASPSQSTSGHRGKARSGCGSKK